MKIFFKINYKTEWGQELRIVGSVPQLGGWKDDKAAVMFPANGDSGDWDFTLDLKGVKAKTLEYKYQLIDTRNNITFVEYGNPRTIDLKSLSSDTYVTDFWQSAHNPENPLYTSAFTDAIFRHTSKKTAAKAEEQANLFFHIPVARVDSDHKVAIMGNIPELGNWNPDKAFVMDGSDFPMWKAAVKCEKLPAKLLYKYCIVNKDNDFVLDEFEQREIAVADTNVSYMMHDQMFKFPRYPWKGAGVAIPVFSLRSQQGMGVGEFLDLKLLVDWTKKTGLKLIQILPINDTVATHTWTDSYPYAAISVFALHPIYLNLNAIGKLSTKLTQEIIDEQQKYLNALEKIDYEAVMKIKSRFFKLIYDEKKQSLLTDKKFLAFVDENKSWLKPYAAFSYLRDLFGTPEFSRWGRFSTFTQEILDELTDANQPHHDDIAIHYFIQYHLHLQLLDAATYAREKGIVLKGDIPIGIYRNSVDAWMSPQLYNMDKQAGAPPDDFSDKGQNWKFPTYNWEEMAKDGFKWWQDRMRKMSQYFDAFRIDHILGFFRIWEISSYQREGLLGYFNPALTIHRNEISDRCGWFDYDRLCRPYIREHMLYPIFGELMHEVKSRFLEEYQPGQYRFKPEYDNQEKIDNAIESGAWLSAEVRKRNDKLKEGLYYLVSEVILIEQPGSNGERFHPRHSMYKTWSFTELSDHARTQLNDLYFDFFYRRNESFWQQQALIKLPAIKDATNMLICGEDLGMVPDCVPQVMKDMGILSLEVQRMPKNPKHEFGHPSYYPYMSVATPSSHDTSTIRGWWEEDSSRSQRFFNQVLGHFGGSPYFCESWIVRDIVSQHMYSPSMWAIFPIQDFFGMDDSIKLMDAQAERINVPANPTHYWRYRMHHSLEDLMKFDNFNASLLTMVRESGRYYSY